MRDRGFVASLIDRAKAAGCDALVLTLDLQLSGQRHKDLKNGLSIPPRLNPSSLLNILGKPGWIKGMLSTRRHHFGNIMGHVKGVDDMRQLADWTYQQFDPCLSWDDIQWIKERWGGRLILKGILDVEDARLAADSGADGLIVSNHGGRQLDGAPSSISMLPAIVEAVGERIEVWLDSGIRSGQEVIKSLALALCGHTDVQPPRPTSHRASRKAFSAFSSVRSSSNTFNCADVTGNSGSCSCPSLGTGLGMPAL